MLGALKVAATCLFLSRKARTIIFMLALILQTGKVFGRFARSAIRGTPSPAQRGSTHRLYSCIALTRGLRCIAALFINRSFAPINTKRPKGNKQESPGISPRALESGGYLFVLCSARSPRCGNTSGAKLGVPFKALLHRHNACSTHRYPRYCTATWRVVQSHYI